MPSDQLFKGTHMPSWSFLPLSLQTTQDPGCKVPRNVFGSAVAPHHDAISYHLKTWRLFLFSKYFKFQDFMVLLTLTSYCISALAEVPLLLLLLPKAHAHQWLTPAKRVAVHCAHWQSISFAESLSGCYTWTVLSALEVHECRVAHASKRGHCT